MLGRRGWRGYPPTHGPGASNLNRCRRCGRGGGSPAPTWTTPIRAFAILSLGLLTEPGSLMIRVLSASLCTFVAVGLALPAGVHPEGMSVTDG